MERYAYYRILHLTWKQAEQGMLQACPSRQAAKRARRAPEHPFGVLLEADSGHVAAVTVVRLQRLTVGAVHLEYLDARVAGRRQELLVGCDLKLVDLAAATYQVFGHIRCELTRVS